MPAAPPKRSYRGRPKDCVPRTVNFDTETDRMLMELSAGRYSATLRMLVAQEYGRRLAQAEIQGRKRDDA